MGLIGLLIAVVIMILGAGYFLFGGPKTPITVTNDSSTAPIAEELARSRSAIDAARDVKDLVEQKTADISEPAYTPPVAGRISGRQSEDSQPRAGELKIENRLMSSGFSVPKNARTIDTIVLHSSYDLLGKDRYSVSGIVKEYEDYGVSAHYLIDRQGTVYRLVEDRNIAYHAGVSKMPDGRTDVNGFSIGIEMMNTETGQFTKAQYVAVNDLVAYLRKRHPITSVVGHADIAPGRKTDPWNFDWGKLKK